MVAWENPVLTGYSCEDVSSRAIQSRLLLRKDNVRANIWPEILKTGKT